MPDTSDLQENNKLKKTVATLEKNLTNANVKGSADKKHLQQLNDKDGIPNSLKKQFPDSNVEKGPVPSVMWMLNNYFLDEFKTPRGLEEWRKIKYAEGQIKRLIDDKEWTMTVHNSVIENLVEHCTSDFIINGILNYLCSIEQVEEKDLSFTPPAPIMTKTQQKIVTLINCLEPHFPTIFKETQAAIEFSLFRLNCAPSNKKIELLSVLFVALARVKKDRAKVRMFCVDALYCYNLKAVVVIHCALRNWPEVLPIYGTMDDKLALCIMMIIMNMNNPCGSYPKLRNLKQLITLHYQYPTGGISSADFVQQCFVDLLNRPDSSNMETAVSKVYNLDEIQRLNECTIADGAAEATSEVVTKGKSPVEKGIQQSDDELTSLSWLHQQNLLKGLEISKTSKDEVALNNNNVSDESAEFGSNANSCDVDDECSSETEKVVNGNARSNGRHLQPKVEPTRSNNVMQSNQTKISLNNNNLPYLNRNKHPTHIPYDPHLHRNSKPPYSFSCLIFMAIEDSPVKALPVKEVYAWILEHFPYFRNAPTGWKNSVRHNLSLNKCFRKVEKAPNLGKGSLWMVDAQYRPNLIQALSRAPFPPPTAQSISSPEKVPKKSANNRLPDPVLFPYLSKRLASSNICDNIDPEFDSDVDAAAAAMLSFKHGPIILNHNKDRKRRPQEPEKLVPIITRSSSEDHTYSCITSIELESKKDANQDSDEQRKIAEGADALLNLAGVSTMHNHSHVPNNSQETTITRTESVVKSRKRPLSNDRLSSLDKRRRRWRDWGENTRYLKQVKG